MKLVRKSTGYKSVLMSAAVVALTFGSCTKKAPEAAPQANPATAPAGSGAATGANLTNPAPGNGTPGTAAAPNTAPKIPPTAFAYAFKMPGDITPNADQSKKIDEMKTKYIPKLMDVQQKISQVLTPEQKTARAEAVKKALSEGKKGKDLADATMNAGKPSPEQQKQMNDGLAELRKLQMDIRGEIQAMMTPEQKTELAKKAAEMRKTAAANAPASAAKPAAAPAGAHNVPPAARPTTPQHKPAAKAKK